MMMKKTNTDINVLNHDIRSSITSLSAALFLLQKRLTTKDQKEYYEKVSLRVQKITKQIEELSAKLTKLL